jgi:hypothetical protein
MRMQSLSLEVKLNVIRCIEAGEHQLDVCKALDLAGSTVQSVLETTDKIKDCGKIVPTRNVVSPSTLVSWNQLRTLSEGCLYPVLWFYTVHIKLHMLQSTIF